MKDISYKLKHLIVEYGSMFPRHIITKPIIGDAQIHISTCKNKMIDNIEYYYKIRDHIEYYYEERTQYIITKWETTLNIITR